MKKKNIYRLYCGAFIGICLIPAVCTPFVGSESSAEKRTLTAFPKVRTEDNKLNTEFFSEFDTWFSEHFAFRQKLVNADSRIKTAVFSTSPDSDVIAGKNGWLYYGETADDYLNINTLSPAEIGNIAHNLRMIENYCTEQGAEFVFFSAPNKNSLYPENMPANYVPADNKNNYTLLAEELSGDSFFLDMKTALLAADSNIPLYHKTDTHWNNLGAYVGHMAVMNKLGRAVCSAGTEWTTRNDRLGDLAVMIYPEESAKDTQVYNNYEYAYQYQGMFRGLDDITINTVNSSALGNLLMFRDSYGEAILPYMAECFSTAEFSRVLPYRLDSIEGKTVVIEIVERNIEWLGQYAPVMPAPVVDSGIPAQEVTPLVVETEETGRYMHIFGAVPETYFSDGTHTIYIESGGTLYEAFNCLENAVAVDSETDAGGFSLYIPADNYTDNIKIKISD